MLKYSVETHFSTFSCHFYRNNPSKTSSSICRIKCCSVTHILPPSKSRVQIPCCNYDSQLPEEMGEKMTLANRCPRLSSACLSGTAMAAQLRNPLVPAKLHLHLGQVIMLPHSFRVFREHWGLAGRQLGQVCVGGRRCLKLREGAQYQCCV